MITPGSITPNNWRQVKLKYAAQLVSSRADSRPDGLPYVGMENIESHTGRLINAQYQDDEQPPDGISTVNLFEKGDVLFGKLRPYLAKGWLCDFSGASTTEALVLRPGPDINPRYLLHTILSQDFIREVDTTTCGSKMPRADWADIGNLQIYLPPLGIQKKIVVLIDSSTAAVDALLSAKRNLLNLLVEKRRALIARAITRGLNFDAPRRDSGIPWLGNIPAHWDISRVAWLFSERDERCQPHLPLLEVSIHGGVRLREFSDVRIEQVAENLNSYKVAREGDISFNKMRMWQGAVGRTPCDGLVSPDYVVANPTVPLNSEYYGLLFQTPALSAEAGKRSHGIVWDRLRLYWEEFRDISVPVPSLNEQSQIVEHIMVETKKLDSLASATERTIALLRERRSALISAAVTGQLTKEEIHVGA